MHSAIGRVATAQELAQHLNALAVPSMNSWARTGRTLSDWGMKSCCRSRWPTNVRFGSKADIRENVSNVRFTRKSGHPFSNLSSVASASSPPWAESGRAGHYIYEDDRPEICAPMRDQLRSLLSEKGTRLNSAHQQSINGKSGYQSGYLRLLWYA